jgi:hypothetical protein
MFTLLSKFSGVNEDTIILSLLMFLAIIVEVSILALMNPRWDTYYGKVRGASGSRSLDSEKTGQGEVLEGTDMESPDFQDQGDTTASYEPTMGEITPEDFLKAMVDEETFPILLGRDTTARALGIPQYKAKKLVDTLLQEGKIQVCGKRLKATVPMDDILGIDTTREAS